MSENQSGSSAWGRARVLLFFIPWMAVSAFGGWVYLFYWYLYPVTFDSMHPAVVCLCWGWGTAVLGSWARLGFQVQPTQVFLAELLRGSALLIGLLLLFSLSFVGVHPLLGGCVCVLAAIRAARVWRHGPLTRLGTRLAQAMVLLPALLGGFVAALNTSRLDLCLPPHLVHLRHTSQDPAGQRLVWTAMLGGPLRGAWVARCMQLPRLEDPGALALGVSDRPPLGLSAHWRREEAKAPYLGPSSAWSAQVLADAPVVVFSEAHTW